MRKLLALFLSSTLFLAAAESQIDIRLDADTSNMSKKSITTICSTTSLISDNNNHALLASPEMSFYTTGAMDFAVTGIHRHRVSDWVFGHSLFFNRTSSEQIYYDEVGTGFDVQTENCDFRFNYYHPIKYSNEIKLKACRWFDSEIFFKTKYFGVGTGPLYNRDLDIWALHSRIAVPLNACTVNFGAIFRAGVLMPANAVLSVTFHLFGPPKRDALTTAPLHAPRSRIYYAGTYSYKEQPDFIEVPIPAGLMFIPANDKDLTQRSHEKVEAAPDSKPKEKPKGFWDSIFHSHRKTYVVD